MLIKLNELLDKDYKINGEIELATNDKISEILDEISGNINYEISLKKSNKENIYLLFLHIYGKINTLCQVCIDKLEYSIDEIIEIVVLNSENELNDIIVSRNENYDALIMNQEINIPEFVINELIVLLPITFKHNIC